MSKITVEDSVREYLSQVDQRGLLYDKSRLRDSRKERELKKKAHSIFKVFLEGCDYAGESVRGRSSGSMVRYSIRDVICGIKRKSGEEYLIANDYFLFLKDRYNVRIDPFERQLTPLERQLSIAKDMHDFDEARIFDRHEVAQKYLVSDRTIDSDLAALRDGISVMDQRLALRDFHLNNRKVTAISTMHPLFLAQNLTQVVCMLEGLRRMEDTPAMCSYARNTAVSIWCQLSDYARERIMDTLVDLMQLDGRWYEMISREAVHRKSTVGGESGSPMFYDETQTSDRKGLLLYALKGSIPCTICYIDESDKKSEIRGIVRSVRGNIVEIIPQEDIQDENDPNAPGSHSLQGSNDEIPKKADKGERFDLRGKKTKVKISIERILEVEVAAELR